MEKYLSLYELGRFLEEITSRYTTNLVSKVKLSGGWMTITGKVETEYIPKDDNIIGGNNIISLRVSNKEEEWSSIKITGIKGQKFNSSISKAKYKEINKCGISINQIKEKENQCTFKIDDNIVFTINVSFQTAFDILNKV